MYLVVGLGNPGPKYELNRHNIGFLAVDQILRQNKFAPPKDKFNSHFCEGDVAAPGAADIRCRVLKPQTYMNESGRAVGEALRFYKLEPKDVIVIYDEIDLERGKIRLKTGGGFAGHNGLKSIGAHIGADFQRLRLGVGHPGAKHLVSGYVLKDFAKAEMKWVADLTESIGRHFGVILAGDGPGFLNKVALDTRDALSTLNEAESKSKP